MSPAIALRRAAAWLLRGAAGTGAPRAASSAALPGMRGALLSPARGLQGSEAAGFLGIWGGPAAGGSGGSWWFRCAASSVPRPGLLVEQLLVGGGRSFATGAAPEEVSFSPAAREADVSQPEKSAGTSDKTMLGDRSLKLVSGVCYLPHPDKEETGGQYARDIMSNAVTAIEEEPKDSIDLTRVLEKAHSSTTVPGSSTACIIAITNQGIQAINLGDSGFIVIRDGCTLCRSPVQQHDFNFSYQLQSGNSSDLPNAAQVFKVPVASGDVIVAGTDGLFDNLYNNDITAVVVHATRAGLEPQVTAQKIAALARQRAQDKNRPTPFSTAAQDAGYRYYGGKLDDITVVVSYVTAFGNS
ncbi:hypothetical protein ACQJBY_053519 [Aegilops geniculata]